MILPYIPKVCYTIHIPFNSKQKGDVAVGRCIAYYCARGYEVLLPLGDKSKYDLVVDIDDKLVKIQIKYAGTKSGCNCWSASLRTSSINTHGLKEFQYGDDDFDILFCVTPDGDMYEVPWGPTIAKTTLSMNAVAEHQVVL